MYSVVGSMYNYYLASSSEYHRGVNSTINLQVYYRKDGFSTSDLAENHRDEVWLDFDETFVCLTVDAPEVGDIE